MLEASPAALAEHRDVSPAPYWKIAAFLVERNYKQLGCDRWNSREVKLLCAKTGDSPSVMAIRLRLRPSDFNRRMETDCWTKQDGLILTMLSREVDFLRGGLPPRGMFVATANPGSD